MNKHSILLFSLLAVAIAGCASNSIPDPEPSAEASDSSADSAAYGSENLGQGQSFGSDHSDDINTVIYFDYDQAELKPEYVDMLARHARRLSEMGEVRVRLEGHADERGSREYNVGLGERRSQAVRRALAAHGVPNDQLSTVSFGEEQPAAYGSNEQSYAMNRRVEINYLN
jgi:peptidoglycan-associated lipoprotein